MFVRFLSKLGFVFCFFQAPKRLWPAWTRRPETSSCPWRPARSARRPSSCGPRTTSPSESAPVWPSAAKAERKAVTDPRAAPLFHPLFSFLTPPPLSCLFPLVPFLTPLSSFHPPPPHFSFLSPHSSLLFPPFFLLSSSLLPPHSSPLHILPFLSKMRGILFLR